MPMLNARCCDLRLFLGRIQSLEKVTFEVTVVICGYSLVGYNISPSIYTSAIVVICGYSLVGYNEEETEAETEEL